MLSAALLRSFWIDPSWFVPLSAGQALDDPVNGASAANGKTAAGPHAEASTPSAALAEELVDQGLSNSC